jgi:cytochrome c oxidase cbb3-type subunit 3
MRRVIILAVLAFLSGCSQESHALGPDQPQTVPRGSDDPRATRYDDNAYQISQGGRYFTWYGCGACHGADATGALDLHAHSGGFEQVYRAIVRGHRGADYGARVPVEQLWQMTAYVREVGRIDPTKRRRQDIDQSGEPQGDSWSGPVR